MKLIFLGNSLVEGKYGGDFVAAVAKRLPKHTVINAGKSGSTILNLLKRLDDVLAHEPDGIFVVCGGNDAISHSQPQTRHYYEQVQKVPGGEVTPELYARGIRDLLTQIQLAHVLAWVALAPLEYNLETAQAIQQYNALTAEVAHAANIPVLDLAARLSPAHIPARPALTQADINLIGKRINSGWSDYAAERERGGYTYTFDGLHFTPETAQQAAEWIVTFLELD